ncbi:MAG: hypothetical protein ACLUTU_00515 [Blautia faecis]
MQIIGVGPQLAELEKEEKELYQERLYVGRTADQKEKFAKSSLITRRLQEIWCHPLS